MPGAGEKVICLHKAVTLYSKEHQQEDWAKTEEATQLTAVLGIDFTSEPGNHSFFLLAIYSQRCLPCIASCDIPESDSSS